MGLGMPCVHIWNIPHIDRSGSSPACFFPWPYETTPEALARNVEGLKKFGGLYAPILAVAYSGRGSRLRAQQSRGILVEIESDVRMLTRDGSWHLRGDPTLNAGFDRLRFSLIGNHNNDFP